MLVSDHVWVWRAAPLSSRHCRASVLSLAVLGGARVVAKAADEPGRGQCCCCCCRIDGDDDAGCSKNLCMQPDGRVLAKGGSASYGAQPPFYVSFPPSP
jgi:hypothetical protein